MNLNSQRFNRMGIKSLKRINECHWNNGTFGIHGTFKRAAFKFQQFIPLRLLVPSGKII